MTDLIDVFSIKSGMGGAFTVSIIKETTDSVLVRVWYGRPSVNGWNSWGEWDGMEIKTTRDQLYNPAKQMLRKPHESLYA